MIRTPISELPLDINESFVIKFNSEYSIDTIEYNFTDEIELANEFELSVSRVCIVDTQLNSTDMR